MAYGMLIKSKRKPAQEERLVVKNDDRVIASCKDVDVLPSFSPSGDLALFHRHEIHIGNLVGAGSFSQVYEITSFDDCLGSSSSSSKDKKKKRQRIKRSKSSSRAVSAMSSSSLELDPMQHQRRKQLLLEQEENTHSRCSGKTLQSRYVIKQLHSKLLNDPKTFRRAVRDMAMEVSIMSLLTHHPHVAHLRATAIGGTGALANGKHDSYFIILDRLVETLEDRIQQWNVDKLELGPASYHLQSDARDAHLSLKANYAWQIASALNFLHQHNTSTSIVFRDLKPQNIGFRQVHPDHPERDVLVLFDFGLSRIMPSIEQADAEGLFRMSLVGTRRYMAPEVVVTRTYNTKVDVYSWALVFFEMVAQQRPYDNMQRTEHKQHVCVDGKRPKLYGYYGLTPELEKLIRLSWAQDVGKRLSMDSVCHVLEDYLTGTIHENAVLAMEHAAVETSVVDTKSVSSIVSGVTEQTMSTTSNSFRLEEEENEEEEFSANHTNATAITTTTSNNNSTDAPTLYVVNTNSEARTRVIQAVMVEPPAMQSPSENDSDPIVHDPGMSFCERCTRAFHASVSGAFQMMLQTTK
jgi:serine/threonine protein kinase